MFKKLFYPCVNVLPMDLLQCTTDSEVVCHLVTLVNQLIENVNNVNSGLITANQAIEELQKTVAAIQAELEKVKNGDYVDLYLDSIINWIDDNLQQLVGRIVKYVFFGLTDDGHFAAYIPDSWNFIRFDTNIDPTSPNYGHLYLYY